MESFDSHHVHPKVKVSLAEYRSKKEKMQTCALFLPNYNKVPFGNAMHLVLDAYIQGSTM